MHWLGWFIIVIVIIIGSVTATHVESIVLTKPLDESKWDGDKQIKGDSSLHINQLQAFDGFGFPIPLSCADPCTSSKHPNNPPEGPISYPPKMYHSKYQPVANKEDHWLHYLVPWDRHVQTIVITNRATTRWRLNGCTVDVKFWGWFPARYTIEGNNIDKVIINMLTGISYEYAA